MPTGMNGMYPAKKQGTGFTGEQYSGGAGSPPNPVRMPGAKTPAAAAQSSGRVTHQRPGGMNIAGKGENLEGFPTDHQAG